MMIKMCRANSFFSYIVFLVMLLNGSIAAYATDKIHQTNQPTAPKSDMEDDDFVVTPQIGHTRSVRVIKYTPDGTSIVTGGYDNAIKMWDVQSGVLIRSLSGHLSTVRSIAIAPDGSILASGSESGIIKLWNLRTGKLLRSIKGHAEAVSALSIGPEGLALASASVDKTVKLWSLQDGKLIRQREEAGVVLSLAITPDDSGLMIARCSPPKPRTMRWGKKKRIPKNNDRSVVNLLRMDSDEVILTLAHDASCILEVSVTPDGHHVITGDHQGTIRAWDLRTGNLVRKLEGQITGSFALSPDGHRVAVANHTKVNIWDWPSGKLVKSIIGESPHKLDRNPLTIISENTGHADTIDAMSFSPNGQQLVTASQDKHIKIWDVNSEKPIRTIKPYKQEVTALVITPDNRHLISGYGNSQIRIWNIKTGRLLRTLNNHNHRINTLKITLDGKYLLSASKDGDIRQWKLPAGEPFHTFHMPRDRKINYATSLAVMPDGKTFVSCDSHGFIRLWNLQTGDMISASYAGLKMYRGCESLSLSLDGEKLVAVEKKGGTVPCCRLNCNGAKMLLHGKLG